MARARRCARRWRIRRNPFEALRRHAPEEMWQTPCASMMLVVPNEDGLEFLWYGDCAALVKQGDAAVTVVGETFDKRAAEAQRAQALAKEKNLSPAAGLSRPEFIGTLRSSRNRINSGDSWLFSPDVKAAAHVSRRVMKAASHLLLASDGFPGVGQRLWRLQRRQFDDSGDGQGRWAKTARHGRGIARHRLEADDARALATSFRASKSRMMLRRCC